MDTYKRTCCGGFPNDKKDQIRKHMAELAFLQMQAYFKVYKTTPITISCPGLRKDEHEVISYEGRRDLYIGVEKDPEICAENADLVHGDVLSALENARQADIPRPWVIDLDIFKAKITKGEATRVAHAVKNHMPKIACVRFTCPLRNNHKPTIEMEKALRRRFRIISAMNASYRGGKDGKGIPMGVFQYVLERK